MFEDLIRKMRELDGKRISIPIQTDTDGFIDRECPGNNCGFQFKILGTDWDNIPHNSSVFCPRCRHEAGEDAWFTQHQIKDAERQVERYVHGEIDHSLKQGARRFNQQQKRQKNSFVSLSIKVSGTSPRYRIVPIIAGAKIEQKITCQECKTTVAVIGSAFFCPKCGHNSVERTFDEGVKKIQERLDLAKVIRENPTKVGSIDSAENIATDLIESSLSDVITAFQRFSDVVYERETGNVPPFNAFQNLERGSRLWEDHFGETYLNWLSELELRELGKLFQQRHLLAHRQGIVDQKYIDRSGDTSYIVGQKLVVKGSDIRFLVRLVEKIVAAIRSKRN